MHKLKESLRALLNSENRLFVFARQSKHLPSWLWAMTLSQIFVLMGSFPATIVMLWLLFTNPAFSLSMSNDQMLYLLLSPPAAQVTMLVLGFAPILLLIWVRVVWYEGRPWRSLGLEPAGALRKFLQGIGIGVGAFSAVVLLMALSGSLALQSSADAARPGVGAALLPLLMLLAWCVQGPTEEVLTRGWLMQVVGARYRPWVGVLISVLTFALLHVVNLHFSWLALLNLLLVALFLSLFALREEGLWGVCGFHAAWNWTQGNVFGFEVSGTPPAGGAILDLQSTGPTWITGGGFGPEGGLATTLVMLAAIFLVVFLSRDRSKAVVDGRGDGLSDMS